MHSSHIPPKPKVLEKIECYGDANSEEYKERKEQSTAGSSGSGSGTCSTTSLIVDSVGSTSGSGSGSGVHQQQHHHRRHRRCTSSSISANNNNLIRTNSWFVAQTDWTADDIADTKNNHSHNSTCNNNSSNDNNNKHNDGTKGGGVEGGIQDRIQMIKNMNRLDDDINFVDKEGTHMIVQTDGMMEEFAPISRALYAESVKNGEYNSVYVFVSYLPWRMSCCSFCT